MQRLFARSRIYLLVGSISAVSVAGVLAADSGQVQQLRSTNNCRDCDLTGAELSGSTLAKADLSGANLADANLYAVDLRGADLTGANLANANLSKANLTGAAGALLGNALTDERTICPNGIAGPCGK